MAQKILTFEDGVSIYPLFNCFADARPFDGTSTGSGSTPGPGNKYSKWILKLNSDYINSTDMKYDELENLLNLVGVTLTPDNSAFTMVDSNNRPLRPDVIGFQSLKYTEKFNYYLLITLISRDTDIPGPASVLTILINRYHVLLSKGDNRMQKLSKRQIEELVSNIVIPSALEITAKTITESMRDQYRIMLKKVRLTPLAYPDFYNKFVFAFKDSLIDVATPIGPHSAEAMGEPVTQMTLKTFHFAGTATNVSFGLKQMTETLECSKTRDRENFTIVFKNNNLSFDDVYSKRSEILDVKIVSLLKADPFVQSCEEVPQSHWHVFYNKTHPALPIPKCKFMVRLYFKVERLYEFKLTTSFIANVLEDYENTPLIAVPSATSDGIIDIYPIPDRIEAFLTSFFAGTSKGKGRGKAPKKSLLDISGSIKQVLGEHNIYQLFLKNCVINELKNVYIKGVKHVLESNPVECPVLTILLDEQPISLNKMHIRYSNDPSMIKAHSIFDLLQDLLPDDLPDSQVVDPSDSYSDIESMIKKSVYLQQIYDYLSGKLTLQMTFYQFISKIKAISVETTQTGKLIYEFLHHLVMDSPLKSNESNESSSQSNVASSKADIWKKLLELVNQVILTAIMDKEQSEKTPEELIALTSTLSSTASESTDSYPKLSLARKFHRNKYSPDQWRALPQEQRIAEITTARDSGNGVYRWKFYYNLINIQKTGIYYGKLKLLLDFLNIRVVSHLNDRSKMSITDQEIMANIYRNSESKIHTQDVIFSRGLILETRVNRSPSDIIKDAISYETNRKLKIFKESNYIIYQKPSKIDYLSQAYFVTTSNDVEPKGAQQKRNNAQLINILSMDGIDYTRCYCNDVHQIYRTLGIEASATYLFKTIHDILKYQNAVIDMCHVRVIVDFMVYRGEPTSTNYIGMSKMNVGPFTAAAFSHAMKFIHKASAVGGKEELSTIVGSVIIGRETNIGTGQAEAKPSKIVMERVEKIEQISGDDLFSALPELGGATKSITPITSQSVGEPLKQYSSTLTSNAQSSVNNNLTKTIMDTKPIFAPIASGPGTSGASFNVPITSAPTFASMPSKTSIVPISAPSTSQIVSVPVSKAPSFAQYSPVASVPVAKAPTFPQYSPATSASITAAPTFPPVASSVPVAKAPTFPQYSPATSVPVAKAPTFSQGASSVSITSAPRFGAGVITEGPSNIDTALTPPNLTKIVASQ
jgi:hypothetical protein